MSYTKNFSDTYSRSAVWTMGTVKSVGSESKTLVGVRSGSAVKDWRKRIALGSDATSGFTSDRYKLRLSPGHASLSGLSNTVPPIGASKTSISQTWAGNIGFPIGGTTLTHTAPSGKADAAAKSQVYRKIDAEVSHMNSPAVLAEFTDVVRQFGAPFASIVDLTNRRLNRLELERRGLKGSISFKKIKWLEIVASTYLEYSFGLGPLISDTRDLAETVARWQFEKTGESRQRSRVVGRGSEIVTSNTFSPERGAGPVGSHFFFGETTKDTSEYRVQYVCGLNATRVADFGSNDRLLQLLGFRPENWIPAIWEVVPWSFLIDYFTNVGDILKAGVTSTASVSWISKTVSQRTERNTSATANSSKIRASLLASNFAGSGSGSGGDGNVVRTTVTRTPQVNLGVPPLSVSVPTDIQKLANMAALLFARKPSSSALWLY